MTERALQNPFHRLFVNEILLSLQTLFRGVRSQLSHELEFQKLVTLGIFKRKCKLMVPEASLNPRNMERIPLSPFTISLFNIYRHFSTMLLVAINTNPKARYNYFIRSHS